MNTTTNSGLTQIRKTFLAPIASVALAIAASTVAHADTIVFMDDFSSGIADPKFSGAGSVVGVGGYGGINGFADNFLHNDTGVIGAGAGQSTILALSGLAAHTSMTIEFDLAMIDSWDGTSGAHAPDFFNLNVDGSSELVVSVDNGESSATEIVPAAATDRIPLTQLFGNGLLTDPDCTGFFCDSGFSISLTIAHTANSALLSFFANGQGYHSAIGALDESWAIDNVKISTNAISAVPLPAAFPLFAGGLGLMGLLGWRRKRSAAA